MVASAPLPRTAPTMTAFCPAGTRHRQAALRTKLDVEVTTALWSQFSCAADTFMDMWINVLWALAGALAYGLVQYLEDSRNSKTGLPWSKTKKGPGAAPYFCGIMIHLVVAGLVGAAFSSAGYITNSVMGFVVGAAAPSVVRALIAQLQRNLDRISVGGGEAHE